MVDVEQQDGLNDHRFGWDHRLAVGARRADSVELVEAELTDPTNTFASTIGSTSCGQANVVVLYTAAGPNAGLHRSVLGRRAKAIYRHAIYIVTAPLADEKAM